MRKANINDLRRSDSPRTSRLIIIKEFTGKRLGCGTRLGRSFILALIVLVGLCVECFAADSAWKEIKDKHFVIYYEAQSDESLARDLLRRAEDYYRKIGDEIGYSRTNKLWTWEERVQIFLFATQSSYLANTGQPLWSTGYADRDSRLFKSKTIMTYRQEEDFVDGLLPHEISHLILHDFIPNDEGIPVWFDEGVAQMQEKEKRPMARKIMKTLTSGKQYISFPQFVKFDVRRERDPRKAQIFYVQSLSVVDYLVTNFGADTFRRLCRNLRDNKDFYEALFSAYSGRFKDLADLERKWILSFNH